MTGSRVVAVASLQEREWNQEKGRGIIHEILNDLIVEKEG